MQHSKASKSGEGTLYGAKITGGGSGGTVCVIGRNSLKSSEQILEVMSLSFKGYLSPLLPSNSLFTPIQEKYTIVMFVPIWAL